MTRRVRREDWIDAAAQALGEAGIDGLAVEPLARRLGVTKGSFYWHIAGIAALVAAVLETWRRLATDEVIRALETIADPGERLARLFAVTWDRVEHLRIESALSAAAVAGDARVRPTYLAVNRRRLAYTRRLYRRLGLSRDEAARWALTAYGAYLGTLQLVALGSGFASQKELDAHAAHLARVLVPRRARGGI